MADQLALSWDRHRLTGIEISPAAAGPRILAAFSVDWPEQPPTATWLRETLRRHGINAKQVVLGLPREDAVLRLLEFNHARTHHLNDSQTEASRLSQRLPTRETPKQSSALIT